MKRGIIKKSDCKAVLVYFPFDLIERLDADLPNYDTDRCKYIRNAVREKLARGRVLEGAGK